MECDRFDQISAFADDELAPDARLDCEQHLETCTACRAILAELTTLRQRLAGLRSAPVPAAVGASLARARRDANGSWWTRPLAAAAGALLTFGLGWATAPRPGRPLPDPALQFAAPDTVVQAASSVAWPAEVRLVDHLLMEEDR